MEILIIELKKLVLLYQHKLHMKSTTSLYSNIQQYQVHEIFVFYVFYCNLKKKKNYVGNQYYYHLILPKIRVGWAHTTKFKLPSPNGKFAVTGIQTCQRQSNL